MANLSNMYAASTDPIRWNRKKECKKCSERYKCLTEDINICEFASTSSIYGVYNSTAGSSAVGFSTTTGHSQGHIVYLSDDGSYYYKMEV